MERVFSCFIRERVCVRPKRLLVLIPNSVYVQITRCANCEQCVREKRLLKTLQKVCVNFLKSRI